MWANFISHRPMPQAAEIFHNFRKEIISHSAQAEYFTYRFAMVQIRSQRTKNIFSIVDSQTVEILTQSR